MMEHTYFVCRSSWCISITICAEYTDFYNTHKEGNAIKAADRIWLKFADKPIIENELFCDEDLVYLAKGLSIVQKEIINKSKYKNTLIIISSLQFNICDFQEEGLTAAMMEWAAIAFGFQPPAIDVAFDKESNRYIFGF